MVEVRYDDDKVMIRFEKDLMDENSINRLVEHLRLESARRRDKAGDEKLRWDPDTCASFLTGADLLNDPFLNKGIAFTSEEREAMGLQGLLPSQILSLEQQARRVLENVRARSTDLYKYVSIMAVHDRNRTLFYKVLIDNIEELMPIVYTPTVGKACQLYAHIYQRPRGVFISTRDRGKIKDHLKNWRFKNVRIIVVTDGERILGLGDLGADGMGIPVGKLALYTACGGLQPSSGLAVTLDVGTENKSLLKDPLYIGLQERRLRGESYDQLVEEFVLGVQEVFPGALIQFEDFAGVNAIRFLKKYSNRVCMFNDDIQGTAAVALAGLFSALRIRGGRLEDQKILFLGAGEAGTGIGELVVKAMRAEGLNEAEARRRCWFMDSKGLVVKSRPDLAVHKIPFAHDHEPLAMLLEAVEILKPTAIVGVSGQPAAFNPEVLAAMARINERPIIFALSNPTTKSECTAEEAYSCTEGRVIFASGSPFKPVIFKGETFVPAQGNNVYIFPGVGLGVTACRSRRVTDEMFLVAARTLAGQVSEEDLAEGRLYPPLTKIREVSLAVAEAVAELAYEKGLAEETRPDDLAAFIRSRMYEPIYESYISE